MRLRDLVVVLDDSPRASVQLAMAMELARRHDAHLSGVCPLDLLLPSDIGVLLGGYPDALAMQYVTEQMDAQSREKADAIEARFREQLRVNEVRGDWQAERGIVGDVVSTRLRTADLAVIGQPDPNAAQSAMSRYLLEDVLLLAGRPVLAVPYAGSFNAEFRTAMVAWTDSREAARALNDALPLLHGASNVTVLTVQRERAAEEEDLPGADAAEHLARHGISATAARTVTDGGVSEADAILNYAADISAELIVCGCYGHSRARELILGGVSRGLLEHMTVPVLMSH